MSDSATPWTIAFQAPLSMGFFRQKYWSGLPFPSPADLPDPGIEPRSPALQADSLPTEHHHVHADMEKAKVLSTGVNPWNIEKRAEKGCVCVCVWGEGC